MKFKDYEPINLKMFQTDIEKIMYQLNKVLNDEPDKEQIELIKQDLEHKISIHKEKGEWV